MKKLLLAFFLLTLPVGAQNIARMFSGTNPQTGTSYTLTQGDETKFVTFSNTSPVAVTIPSASTPGFGPGVVITVKNIGTGNVTITPVAGLINGGASLVLTTGQGLDIYSDGVNWTGNGGVGSGGGNVSSVNTIPKGTGPGLPLVDSTCSDDGTNPVQCVHGLNVGVSGLYYQWGNDTSTGTAQFKAAINNGSGQAVTASTATTTGIIGVVEVGAGTSGNSTLCFGGRCPALFDNSAVSGDWAILSSTVAGEFHDTGSTSQTPGPQNVKVSGGNAGAGTVGQITMLSPDSTGTPGMLNPMTTACDLIVGGTAGAPARLACPTGPNGVSQYLTSTPSGGVGQTASFQPSGIVPRYVSGTSDTIASTDRGAFVQYTNSSSVAVTVPQAGTTGFASNFYFCASNRGSGNVVFTPTTSTVNGAATFTLATNASTCFISDNANYITKDSGGGGGSGTVNNLQTLGPNPWFDLSRYGLYTGAGAAITCTTTATSTSVTCPGGVGDFAIGNGIEIPGAGPAATFPTWGVAGITAYVRSGNKATYTYTGPTFGAGQTVTIAGLVDSSFNGPFTVLSNNGNTGGPATFTVTNSGADFGPATNPGTATLTSAQVTVNPQGILNGTTSYAYQVVLRGYNGELSAASTAGSTSVGAATLGINTATLTGCSRTSTLVTCTTSAAHNFQAGVLTDIEGISDSTFKGEHLIVTTPTSTTFTFTQANYGNSSGASGTAKVVAKNMVRWNMQQYANIQAIVYRSKNGGAYSIAGIVEGMDGAFVDWGAGSVTVPSNVPSTPPGSATNGILATTITGISGTTLTLASPAVATVTSVSSQHDNAPIVIAGCNALGANGVGILYIPVSNPASTVPFNSPTDMYHNCNARQVVVQVGSTLQVNEPIVLMRAGTTWKGAAPSGLAPTFGIGSSTQVNGGAYPFFLVVPGSFGPNTIDSLNMLVNHPYQSAIVEDADAGGGAVVNTQYINDYFTAGSGGEMPYISRGGFNKFFDKGAFNTPGQWGVPELMEFTTPNSQGICAACNTLPYLIKLDRIQFAGHGIQWDDWGNLVTSVGGYMSINDTLMESAYSPLLTINTGTTGSVITGIQLNRNLIADNVIPAPVVLVRSILGALQSNLTSCSQGGMLSEGPVNGLQAVQGTSDSCAGGAISSITTNLFGGVGAAYQQNLSFPTQLAGTASVYYVMDTPSAAPTLAVSAGGSVPVSATMCFAISALDNSGGETVIGPSACTVTTAGNQTVTITRPTLPGNATGWYVYWNQGVNGNSFSRVPAFIIGAGTLTYVHAASFGNGNSVQNYTTAGKSLIGSGGLSSQQGTFNRTDFSSQAAPSNPAAGFCRMYYDSSSGVLTGINSSGSNCLGSGTASTTAGLNNVTTYAAGITITDGAAHTVSTAPGGSPFNGVTTKAGIAAIVVNGTTPFSWITSSPFNAGPYSLADADVPNLDIAWLAGQACIITGKCYFPPGNYLVGSVRTLPFYIPLAAETGTNLAATEIMIKGAGARVSVILAGTDFGAGVPLIACGDPAGTFANSLGRYSGNPAQCSGDLEDIGFFPSTTVTASLLPTIGTTPVAMTGIAWGARLRTKDVESSGFGKDWDVVGDHTQFIRPRAFGGTYGFYWNRPNSSLLGDLTFDDFMVSGQSQASIAVHPLATISGAVFNGETYLSAPYAIFGETGNCNDILNAVRFDHFFAEYLGNAVVTDDNNFAAGTYTDSNKCRGISNTVFGDFFTTYSNGTFWSTGSRARRAAFDVQGVNLTIQKLITQGGSFNPPNAPSGPATLSTFNVNSSSTSQGGTKIVGNISGWMNNSGAVPTGVVALIEQPGVWAGEIVPWVNTAGNYTTTTSGDLFEFDQYWAAPSGSNRETFNSVRGVVVQGGLSQASGTAFVPLATSGTIGVNTGYAGFQPGLWKQGSGIGRTVGITAAGSGGTNGTFSWTVTANHCGTDPTGTFTVAGGVVTATTITTHGDHCTAAPTLATAASGGLSGATLTAKWPGALASYVSSTSDAGIIGNNVGGTYPNNGSNYASIRLQLSGGAGLQAVAGSVALPTGALTTGTCASPVTVASPGATTTSAVAWNFASDPNGVTGYGATATAVTINVWATANTINIRQCNNTGSSITPGAMSVNARVIQ
jgi:hypothetical protein